MTFQAPLTDQSTPGTVADRVRQNVDELDAGERIDCVYVIRDASKRPRKDGRDWLKLTLGDATGTIGAKCWDDVESLAEIAHAGAVVRVQGRFEVSERWGDSIVVEAMAPAIPGEYEAAELTASSPVAAEQLTDQLTELLDTIQQPQLRELLDRFFAPDAERWQRFHSAPAAKHYHQAYVHGLLEHTVSVAQAVSAAASTFPGIDRDVAITGALLHDIGKTEAYNNDPMAIDLTDAGRLQGEIPLGYYTVRREIESIDGFDPELAQAVLHIVLSHHGKLEHGSPVVPATREATLVHAMDNLGGTLGSFDRIERELSEGEQWSRFDRGIDSAAYFAKRAA